MFLSLDSGTISALPCTTSCLLYKHKALILTGYHFLSSNTVSCVLIWSLTLTFTACWASEQTSFYNSHKHQTSQCEHFHAVKIPNVRAEVLTRVIVFCALTTANDLLYWYWSGKLNMKVIRHVSAVWLHQGCGNSLWSNGLKKPTRFMVSNRLPRDEILKSFSSSSCEKGEQTAHTRGDKHTQTQPSISCSGW